MKCVCNEHGPCFYHVYKEINADDGFFKEQAALQKPPVHVVDPNESGTKHDDGKFDPTMLSTEMIELVSRVRMFGARKYSRNNWKKGFKVTRSLAAALRHIYAFMNGENDDKESGLSHLGHAICCLEHAVYDMQHHKENDDRKSE